VPKFDEDVTVPAAVRDVWDWEITSSRTTDSGEPEYLSLDVVLNTTAGFSRQGIVRLELPDKDDIGVPQNDVTLDVNAGVGNRPPRLDDSAVADRTIAWLRLRPVHHSHALALSWIGINAVEIDQRKTLSGVTVATSGGMADQRIQLPGQSVEPESLKLQVEEEGRGFINWQRIDDLYTADRDDRVYQLDSEAGTVTFGNGVRGAIPAAGMRLRIEQMRYGGGAGGNLAAGNLNAVTHAGLKVSQPVATTGGAEAVPRSRQEKQSRPEDSQAQPMHSEEGTDAPEKEEASGSREEIKAEVEGEGKPPELPVVLPEGLQEDDLLGHVDHFAHQVLLPGFGPPVHFLKVGAAPCSPSLLMGNRRELPPEVDGEARHPEGPDGKRRHEDRQEHVGDQKKNRKGHVRSRAC